MGFFLNKKFMKAIELCIQEAEEKADEWIAFLATYSDERLSKRIDIIHKQQLIAEQNKDALGFEYMLLMEHITICARMYKEEHNVADVIDEAEEELKQVETVVVSSEKRQEVFNENLATKKQTSKIQIDNSNQTSLF